ncbi:MAG: glycosyltransferase family 4 protein, partial [Anaerolineales bacterium]
QQKPYNVIHFHTISCAPLFCIAKQFGASVVYGHHNLISQRHTKEDIQSLVAELKWVDKVVCVSKIAAEDFINATNIPSSKVVTIYNPSFLTEEDDRSFSGERYREKGHLVAGTASNLEGPKGIDVLLQAWQKLCEDGIDARLMIAGGREPYLSYWRKQSVEMGLSECVFFLGQIEDKSKMFDFYRSIDLLIIPSRSEAFPLQAVEAMSRSLALLASDIPVLREVLGDSGCFFQVEDAQDLAEKVKVFVQSPEIIVDLGKAARSRWKSQYHPAIIIDQYENLYRTLAQNREK